MCDILCVCAEARIHPGQVASQSQGIISMPSLVNRYYNYKSGAADGISWTPCNDCSALRGQELNICSNFLKTYFYFIVFMFISIYSVVKKAKIHFCDKLF